MIRSTVDPAAPPMSWRDALLASLVLTLARPATWAVALAGFLARGGLLWFLIPIVPLPTTASLATEVAPRLRPVVLGSMTAEFTILAALIVGAILAWLVVGGLIGAWTDVQLIRAAAADEELGYEIETPPPNRGLLWRAAAVRVAAHLPLAVVLAAATPVLIAALYAELTNPGEVVSPLVQRTLARIPEVVAAVLVAWLVGEVAGGLGVRALVLDRADGWLRAAIGGYRELLLHLPSSAVTAAVTWLAVGAAIVPAALAATLGWSFTRLALLGSRAAAEIVASTVLFVAIWTGGLVIAGAAAAWRNHAWTAEWLRRNGSRERRSLTDGSTPVGTIGGSDRHRRGGWSPPEASGKV